MSKQLKVTYAFLVLLLITILLNRFVFPGEQILFLLIYFYVLEIGISVIYNIVNFIKKKESKDLWKLGFLGIVGLVGLVPGISYFFLGFFILFGFFAAKKKS